MSSISKDMMGANSNELILRILKINDSYGYEIQRKIYKLSSGKIDWKAGSLYPILTKLEKRKLIKSYWNVKDFERPRKYYKILKKGIDELYLLTEARMLIDSILHKIENGE